MSIFIIDGVDYSALVHAESITESFETIAHDTAATKQDGADYFDMIGTRFSHSLTLKKRNATTAAQWDALYDVISNPTESHTVTLPHNQSTITYDAHIYNGSRPLLRQAVGVNVWGDITIEMKAISSQKEA